MKLKVDQAYLYTGYPNIKRPVALAVLLVSDGFLHAEISRKSLRILTFDREEGCKLPYGTYKLDSELQQWACKLACREKDLPITIEFNDEQMKARLIK